MTLALQADEALLSRVQAAAQTAYMAARALRNAPFNGIDRTWREAQTTSLLAIEKAGGRDVIGTRKQADWTARVAMLRLAMEAGDHFRALVTRYDTISEEDRARAASQDAMEAASLRSQLGAVTIVSPPFNVQPLLAGLAQRGIHLSASAGGAALASPSRFLTAQDREALRTHKVAIVAALDDVEVF
ncbi:MAG: hypothetical protein ACRYHQ_14055 [Janthinobacterium lividum]